MATRSAKGASKRSPRKKTAAPASRGLDAAEIAAAAAPAETALEHALARDGVVVLARYHEPVGGHAVIFAAVPIERVEPAPFQRDLSETHVKRLTEVVSRLDHYLDPIVLVHTPDGHYWTPNGHHRLAAMRRLGAKAITALILTDARLMYQILALNTEKSPNLKDRALEVVRMARLLADLEPRPESDFAAEFDEPGLLTLGAAYERNARFSGSVYQPLVRRCDGFLELRLPEALEERERRAEALLEVDERVAEVVAALKSRGFESPYLKAFVVARVNPLRFSKRDHADFDDTLGKMKRALAEFDPAKVKKEQVSAAAGYGPPED